MDLKQDEISLKEIRFQQFPVEIQTGFILATNNLLHAL
jgi:hypothetical protein